MRLQTRLRQRGSRKSARPFLSEHRNNRREACFGPASPVRLTLLAGAAIILFAAASPLTLAQPKPLPPTFEEFLQQYVGKEILLLDGSPDLEQTDEADSMQRYVAVLESVSEQGIVVRRNKANDKRSLSYSLANIHRITYLFNARRYRRIVVETR